ncbi:hypothetical protein OH77DRAFT_1461862 [Trametes cingulata]|nr:hypothetical protein OH77DRAFT_1461862 [Trametes cingulata]
MQAQIGALQAAQEEMKTSMMEEMKKMRSEFTGGASVSPAAATGASPLKQAESRPTPQGAQRKISKRIAQIAGNSVALTPEEVAKQQKIALTNMVHQHLDTLLGVKDWGTVAKTIKPLTDDEVDSYVQGGDNGLRCTPQNFRIDFLRPWKRFSYNKEARAVFLNNFMDTLEGMAHNIPHHMITKEHVGQILDVYMDSCRRKYRKSLERLEAEEGMKTAKDEEERAKHRQRQQELQRQDDEQRRTAAKGSRRATLYESRAITLVLFELTRHAVLFSRMGPLHMSDDETDGEEVQHSPIYRIIIAAWQSEALRNFLWVLDRLWRMYWAKPENQRRKPGNHPRVRLLRPDSKVELGEAPPGLWRNCYDEAWLKTLRPYERERLGIIDQDYDFTIPQPLLDALAEVERRRAEREALLAARA